MSELVPSKSLAHQIERATDTSKSIKDVLKPVKKYTVGQIRPSLCTKDEEVKEPVEEARENCCL